MQAGDATIFPNCRRLSAVVCCLFFAKSSSLRKIVILPILQIGAKSECLSCVADVVLFRLIAVL